MHKVCRIIEKLILSSGFARMVKRFVNVMVEELVKE